MLLDFGRAILTLNDAHFSLEGEKNGRMPRDANNLYRNANSNRVTIKILRKTRNIPAYIIGDKETVPTDKEQIFVPLANFNDFDIRVRIPSYTVAKANIEVENKPNVSTLDESVTSAMSSDKTTIILTRVNST